MEVNKQQLEWDLKQQTGSKLVKEYVKVVYCHSAYLTYMQSTSCKMPGWIKHKLESRLLGEISITSEMQMTPPLRQKELKSLLMKVKEESEKAGLKVSIQKTKIMASGPISSVSSVGQLCPLFVTLWTAARQASLFITNSQSLLKLMSIKSVMPSNHCLLCRPLLLLPSIFPSIRVFYNESVLCIRFPKYWSFSFSINPSKEYSGLISFRMDWLDLLAVQGTPKSLLQHHSSKASILLH